MLNEDLSYKMDAEKMYKNINKIADKYDTCFEYVVRDLYNIHLHDYE